MKELFSIGGIAVEITEQQWNELCDKVSGFETKIEELKTQNVTLTTKSNELETKNNEYAAKLAEWQTKLNDQQRTIDTLNAAKGDNAGQAKTPSSGHKGVRYDPVQDKLIFD